MVELKKIFFIIYIITRGNSSKKCSVTLIEENTLKNISINKKWKDKK